MNQEQMILLHRIEKLGWLGSLIISKNLEILLVKINNTLTMCRNKQRETSGPKLQ